MNSSVRELDLKSHTQQTDSDMGIGTPKTDIYSLLIDIISFLDELEIIPYENRVLYKQSKRLRFEINLALKELEEL